MNRRRVIFALCLFLTTCGQETAEVLKNTVPADAAQLAVTPTPVFQFDAQLVGNTTSQLFTVTNTGVKGAQALGSDFHLSITFKFEGGYPGVGGTCADTLASGESCLLKVTFAPQYVGDFEQTLRVSFYDGYSQRITDYPVLRGRGI